MKILDTRGGLIAGGEGIAISNIDGEIVEMFYIKNFEAKVTKNKEKIPTLNNRAGISISGMTEGSGTMTIYESTSKFRELMQKYIDTGVDTYFTTTIVNKDPTSALGEQSVTFYNMNLDEVIVSMLDVEQGSAMETEVPFTFDRFEINKAYDEYKA